MYDLINMCFEFYALLTMHRCIISSLNPTWCTILFNIFIYYSSLHVSGIFHSVWVVSGLLIGLNPSSRPDATHTE